MFDEEFSEYLYKVFPLEYADHIQTCRETLYNIGFSLVESNLYYCIPSYRDLDVASSKAFLEQYLHEGFDMVFREFGMEYTERDLYAKCLILRCITNLEECLMHEEIIDIINNDEYTLSETIDELFKLVSTLDVINVTFNLIIHNPQVIIDRLNHIHLDKYISTSDDEPVERLPKNYKEEVSKYLAEFGDTFVTKRYLMGDVPLSKDWNFYFNLFRDELMTLYPNHPDRVLPEFYGLCVLANIDNYRVMQHIKTEVTTMFKNLKFSMQVNMGVEKFFQGRQL